MQTTVSRRRLLGTSALALTATWIAGCTSSAPAATTTSQTSSATPAAAATTPSTIRVGLIPNQAPDQIKLQYEPFRQYLAEKLSAPVELFVATDYAGVVEAMAADKLEVAYFGGLTYVQAETRADLLPLVTEVDAETHTTRYYSAIITRVDSPIQSLADLKAKPDFVFAFGDIGSTSGSLYPRVMLDRAGFGNFTDPQRYIYTGGHDATVLAVQNGRVDAGGVERRIMRRMFEAGRADEQQIRIIEEHLVEGYPWVAPAILDAGIREQITQAFLDIDDPELLRLMRAERYERVTAADYDEVRSEARRLGLLNA